MNLCAYADTDTDADVDVASNEADRASNRFLLKYVVLSWVSFYIFIYLCLSHRSLLIHSKSLLTCVASNRAECESNRYFWMYVVVSFVSFDICSSFIGLF